ncbi:hypothetical protein [Pseudomonas putida]|uniref:hypothetical protein n=1 Tax=Pseudomonas putida TaxID=303 RepID=UPI000B2D1D25|nr:hypothetical protein [Pseudomonas putida]
MDLHLCHGFDEKRKCIGREREVHDFGFIQVSSGAAQAGSMLGYLFALQGTAGR